MTRALTSHDRSVAVNTARSLIGIAGKDTGMCERFVRSRYGFPARYATARLAYLASRAAGGFHARDYNPPAGVPVFFDFDRGPNVNADHVAISIGGGKCISTSVGPNKSPGTVGIRELERRWAGVGCTYLGWAENYHERRIYPSHPTGRYVVDVPTGSHLNGRSGPSIASRVRYRRKRGYRVNVKKFVRGSDGTVWAVTKRWNVYYAAKYLRKA